MAEKNEAIRKALEEIVKAQRKVNWCHEEWMKAKIDRHKAVERFHEVRNEEGKRLQTVFRMEDFYLIEYTPPNSGRPPETFHYIIRLDEEDGSLKYVRTITKFEDPGE